MCCVKCNIWTPLEKNIFIISLSTRAVIGQFCIESSFPARPINLRDIINIFTNLVFSVRTVSYGILVFLSVTYGTDLELG